MYNMPKLECPFEREEQNGHYVVIPKIKEEYRWIFTPEAVAVEKLDGTNISVWIQDHKIISIMNRTRKVDIWQKGKGHVGTGILNAISRGYLDLSQAEGGYFGELIGPKLQGNPYQLKEHFWIPFPYLYARYHYKFWLEFVKTLGGLSDEEIFHEVSELFKGLWSIYKRARRLEGILGSVRDVNQDSKLRGSMAAEGIVFYLKGHENDYTRCCKLRRDMFSWSKDTDKF